MKEAGYLLYHILSIIPEDLAFLLLPLLLCNYFAISLHWTCVIITLIWVLLHPLRMAHILVLRGLILYILLTFLGLSGIIFSIIIHGVWNWYFLENAFNGSKKQ